MTVPTRRALLIVLVAIFLIQTFFVYSDPAGRGTQLSPLAMQGRALWHRHNCQSCHQIYGFGGFLGPDLTNLAGRLGADDSSALEHRFQSVLTSGSARMPAFHMTTGEQQALAAFFLELDASGVGQVSVTNVRPPRELFAELVERALPAAERNAQQQRGWALMQLHGCIDCHLPNETSPFRSTDLALLHSTLERTRIREVLGAGLPEKGMPNFNLSEAEIDALLSILEQLGSVGTALRSDYAASVRAAGGSLFDLPWFEFAR